MLNAITLLYDYNSWATVRLLDSLTQLSPEQCVAPGCSGNGSIKDTLAHFFATQWGWVSWLDGSKTVAQAMATKIDEKDVATIEAAKKKWESIDSQTRRFIASLTEDKLHEDRSFATRSGAAASLPFGHLILHVANHGTHTRAQIIAAIRRAGYNPGNYELLNYLLTQKQGEPAKVSH